MSTTSQAAPPPQKTRKLIYPQRTRRSGPRFAWELAKLYPSSSVRGLRQRELFAELDSYCMFVGYPNSGHSAVGSLLDAHSRIVIAHELDAMGFVGARFNRLQLYQLILANSEFSAARGRVQTGYKYAVPGQWQGRFDRIRVIGDKRGGQSTVRLGRRPELLRRLADTVGLPVKLIHVVRNPYDNISTMARHRATHAELMSQSTTKGEGSDLEVAAEFYFWLADVNLKLGQRGPDHELLEVRHEALIERPREQLEHVCRFLDVDAPEGYLDSCAQIVYGAPHKSRHNAPWTREMIDRVAKAAARYPFLRGYSFDD